MNSNFDAPAAGDRRSARKAATVSRTPSAPATGPSALTHHAVSCLATVCGAEELALTLERASPRLFFFGGWRCRSLSLTRRLRLLSAGEAGRSKIRWPGEAMTGNPLGPGHRRPTAASEEIPST